MHGFEQIRLPPPKKKTTEQLEIKMENNLAFWEWQGQSCESLYGLQLGLLEMDGSLCISD